MTPDLVSLTVGGKMLGISEKTAYRLARAGTFPGGAALKVGRSWRVSVPRLQQWINGFGSAPAPSADADAPAGLPPLGSAGAPFPGPDVPGMRGVEAGANGTPASSPQASAPVLFIGERGVEMTRKGMEWS